MKAVIGIISVLLFSFFVNQVLAVSLSTVNSPTTIDKDQEFEIDVDLQCAGCGDSYLRGVFYPSGSNYFGYTKNNNGDWINLSGTSCTSYFKITEADFNPEGSWSGRLKFKPDSTSSFYSGPGEYFFKVGRYTSSCGSVSVWSQESTITITGPTPTLTPTNTPTPGPTNTPTPTTTPIPTPTPTKSVAPTPTSEPSVSSVASDNENVQKNTKATSANSNSGKISLEGDVLGEKDSLFAGDAKKSDDYFSKILFIAIGIALIIACIILTVRVIKKGENTPDEQ